MSRQAEAERDRRARVIAAEGEFQAWTKLAQAAASMANTPGALQLRLLQTVVEVAAEKNSTLVMPFPVELLCFFEKATSIERHTGTPAHRHSGAGQAPRQRQRTPSRPRAERGRPAVSDHVIPQL